MDHFMIYSNIEEYPINVKVLDDLLGMDQKSEKVFERIIRLESEVEVLSRGIDLVEMSAAEETILDCRMDGMSITEIADHIGIARKTVRERLDNISRRISQALNEGIKE